MKKIEAILKDDSLDSVKDALDKAGFVGMTVFAVKGRGAEGGVMLEWRAGPYRVEFLHRALLMLVVPDEDCQRAIEVIVANCQQEHNGDGRIFVSSVDKVIRVADCVPSTASALTQSA